MKYFQKVTRVMRDQSGDQSMSALDAFLSRAIAEAEPQSVSREMRPTAARRSAQAERATTTTRVFSEAFTIDLASSSDDENDDNEEEKKVDEDQPEPKRQRLHPPAPVPPIEIPLSSESDVLSLSPYSDDSILAPSTLDLFAESEELVDPFWADVLAL